MHTQYVPVLALAGALSFAAVAEPPESSDSSQTIEQLKTIVRDLQTQVDDLKAANNDQWLTQHRADEIRGLVHDVLADADTRSNLLASGAVAGWDKGFFIGSTDGNFLLRVWGQLQFRMVYNHQDDSPVDDDRWGFEMRRAKVGFKGNIVDPSWTYDIQLAADRGSGVVTLEDHGWLQKDLGNGWKIRAGQTKAPFTREEVLSSTRLPAIERSLINSQFTAGTVQGVMVGWEGDTIHVYGMYHDGNRSANTAWSVEDTEYAFSGRAEWLATGEWKNTQDFTSFRDEGTNVVIGGGVSYQKQEFGTTFSPIPVPSGNNAEVENLGLTADITADFGGLGVSGELFYRHLKADATGAEADQWGFLVRGGYFLTDTWEIYAQYEWGDLDNSSVEDLSIVTVGLTKYWDKHNLKWQSDIGYGINEVSSAWAVDAAGWRTDSSGSDGQIVIRSQIQLLF